MHMFLPYFFIGIALLATICALTALWKSISSFGVGLENNDALDLLGAKRTGLVEEKARLLRALKEIESDLKLGTLSQDDFDQLDRRYRGQAKAVFKDLDMLGAQFRPEAEKLLEGVFKESEDVA